MSLITELREIAQHRAEECAGPPAFIRSSPPSFVEWRAADALEESLAIARELARLARCMDAPAPGSIGTQIARLEDLERRVGIRE